MLKTNKLNEITQRFNKVSFIHIRVVQRISDDQSGVEVAEAVAVAIRSVKSPALG